MSDTETDDSEAAREREREVAGLLPALAQLDRTATELQKNTVAGKEVTAAAIGLYEQQAAHARHLLAAAGADSTEVTAAEKKHHGDGARGFAARGLDHATHPRFQTPQPAADSGREHAHDNEEIEL